ncbi:hypothetical protein TNCV_345821 [Trichonephila clavipes]|nr:hypothetical protein TNCV_345821 [Trichonephila clavipes]
MAFHPLSVIYPSSSSDRDGVRLVNSGKTERGESDRISSSINHIMNLTLLTSSKYNELNGQITLSEWTKTAPLKKSSIPNQLAYEERAGKILDGLMA